jgi:anti-sigma factor RsiW
MNDIEDRLRRFQPAGPPPALKARVVCAAGRPQRAGRRWLEWVPVAAAAALAIVFSLLTAHTRSDISSRLSKDEHALEAIGAGPEIPSTLEQATDHD